MKILAVLFSLLFFSGQLFARTITPPCFTIVNPKTGKVAFLIASVHVGFEKDTQIGGDALKAINRANKIWFETAPSDRGSTRAAIFFTPSFHASDPLMQEFLDKVRKKFLALLNQGDLESIKNVNVFGLLTGIEGLLFKQKIPIDTDGVESLIRIKHYGGSKISGLEADGVYKNDILNTSLAEWQEYYSAIENLENCASCDVMLMPKPDDLVNDVGNGSLALVTKAELAIYALIKSSTRKELLQTRRNLRFVSTIDTQMSLNDKKVNTFVMGAAHVVGENNVADQLRALGYEITSGYQVPP
jgi:TraB/PrgY/gumN family